MAQVVKTADGFQVTLTVKEGRTLSRLAAEPPMLSDAKRLERQIATWLRDAGEDFLAADAPDRLAKFAALPAAKQDTIDALLNGG